MYSGAYSEDDYGNKVYDSGALTDMNGRGNGTWQDRGGQRMYNYGDGTSDIFGGGGRMANFGGGGGGGSSSPTPYSYGGGGQFNSRMSQYLQAMNTPAMTAGNRPGPGMPGYTSQAIGPTGAQAMGLLGADATQQQAAQQHKYDMELMRMKMQMEAKLRGDSEIENERNRQLQLEMQRRGFTNQDFSDRRNLYQGYGLSYGGADY